MAKKTTKTDYFTAEHDQTFGDKWTAIFNDINKMEELIETSFKKGHLFFNQATDKKTTYKGFVYSNNSNIFVLTVIEQLKGKEKASLVSACPLMKGINNRIILKDYFTWKGGKAEGEFAGKTDLDRTINFYSPTYPVDMKNFKKNRNQTISLAGLAYSIKKIEEQEHTITKGAFYDLQLKEFLKDNPDKTKKDFKAPIVRITGESFRMFISADFACEYQIAGQIEDIKHIDFLGTKMAVLKVNFEHSKENEFLYCNIYASEHVLKDYVPKIGDGIEAVIWLTGFFN